LGQMTLFDVAKNSSLWNLFIKCLWLCPCGYLGGKKWINSIISIFAHRKWPEMVVSASTNQLWTRITIGSYAHFFCHSESDRSSVILTLFRPGGQILPTIGVVAPEFSLWLRPWSFIVHQKGIMRRKQDLYWYH
jgi:hypothetical protein